ncbi:DsbA family protein [Brachybacterium sp. p3-SID957]|uniref:DsbA family protein n=1 Tax=Brachybacterium sp. p3-SID957 TaxID=2916049 RepID=UPI00223B4DC2|nr:DsbA family protein [Brachybacterium sp. p3-SID957]MCT1775318.1 DsbA family protein [Brachybacterium sp. p3-SID957]
MASSSKSAQSRREAQREAIRKQRQAELRRQRTVRSVVIAVITIAALVLLAGAGYLIYRSLQPEGPVATPQGIPEGQGYLTLGAPSDSGKPVLEVHLDFMCPHCGTFEEVNGADLQTIVEQEEATVHLVPRRIMDRSSSSGDFSTRSANALACVYEDDPDNALAFQQAMFDNQPTQGTAGLSNEEMWEFAQQAGASDSVQSCIDGRTYQGWVRQTANGYAQEKTSVTPYVEIDGTEFQDWSTPGALLEAVRAAGGGAPAPSDGGGASDSGGASDGGQG